MSTVDWNSYWSGMITFIITFLLFSSGLSECEYSPRSWGSDWRELRQWCCFYTNIKFEKIIYFPLTPNLVKTSLEWEDFFMPKWTRKLGQRYQQEILLTKFKYHGHLKITISLMLWLINFSCRDKDNWKTDRTTKARQRKQNKMPQNWNKPKAWSCESYSYLKIAAVIIGVKLHLHLIN